MAANIDASNRPVPFPAVRRHTERPSTVIVWPVVWVSRADTTIGRQFRSSLAGFLRLTNPNGSLKAYPVNFVASSTVFL
jgi:hypothetical protein